MKVKENNKHIKNTVMQSCKYASLIKLIARIYTDIDMHFFENMLAWYLLAYKVCEHRTLYFKTKLFQGITSSLQHTLNRMITIILEYSTSIYIHFTIHIQQQKQVTNQPCSNQYGGFYHHHHVIIINQLPLASSFGLFLHISFFFGKLCW